MSRVRVEARATDGVRCAWCHVAGGDLAVCSRCDTRLHPRCGELAGRCPTLGCGADAPVRSRRLQLWLGAIASAVLGVEAALWRHDAGQPPAARPRPAALVCADAGRSHAWLGELRCGDDDEPRRVEVTIGPGDPCTVVVMPFDGPFPDPRRSLTLDLPPGSRPTRVRSVDYEGLGTILEVAGRSDVTSYIGLRRDGRPVICWLERSSFRTMSITADLDSWRPSGRVEADLVADLAGDDPIARLVALVELEALLKAGALERPDVARAAASRLTAVEEPWTKYAVARLLGRLEGTWP